MPEEIPKRIYPTPSRLIPPSYRIPPKTIKRVYPMLSKPLPPSFKISQDAVNRMSRILRERESLRETSDGRINRLIKENEKLSHEIKNKDDALNKKLISIHELRRIVGYYQENVEEMGKQIKLQPLLYRVNTKAGRKLMESDEFARQFEEGSTFKAVIMAIDIRRSTELMLKARNPELYASFITTLCIQLKQIILDNYGIFDKFTGDGILAFFQIFIAEKI